MWLSPRQKPRYPDGLPFNKEFHFMLISRPRQLRLALPLLFLFYTGGYSGTTQAQMPVSWTPIVELLVSGIGDSDPVRMSTVMTRCTALNMTIAGVLADSSPEMSDHYLNEALRLVQHGVLIDSLLEKEMTGSEADIEALSLVTIDKVRDMLNGYSEWIDGNIAAEGSFLNQEFQLEMDSCQLASKLVGQMSGE
jgi:hypothetical protein